MSAGALRNFLSDRVDQLEYDDPSVKRVLTLVAGKATQRGDPVHKFQILAPAKWLRGHTVVQVGGFCTTHGDPLILTACEHGGWGPVNTDRLADCFAFASLTH